MSNQQDQADDVAAPFSETSHDNNTIKWCNEHDVPRSKCKCPWQPAVKLLPEQRKKSAGETAEPKKNDEPPPFERIDLAAQLDIPLGQRFAREALRGHYVYVPEFGWLRWEGAVWKEVDDDQMLAVAGEWAEQYIFGLIRKKADPRALTQALRYQEVRHVKQLLQGARTLREIVVKAALFDHNPGLLNCLNGVVDLRTGQLLQHDPAFYMTKISATAYKVGAEHEDWSKALQALPDTAAERYVQSWLGSSITGEPGRDDPVIFLQGSGENGKTTIITAIVAALGDHAILIPDSLLGSGDDQGPAWMQLKGARLAYIEELPEGHKLPIHRIKKLACSYEQTARNLYRPFVTFLLTHSLAVSTNYRPRVAETDHGTWRRLVLIPFPNTYVKDGQDSGLKQRVLQSAQAEAVLAWTVAGARQWYSDNRRLPDELPESIKEATDDWRGESDLIANFIHEHLTFTGNAEDRISTKDLLARFNATIPQGTAKYSETLFGGRLRSHPLLQANNATYGRTRDKRSPMGLSGVTWAQLQEWAAEQ